MQLLVEKAAGFESRLTLRRGNKQADAKSILEVMLLAAGKGPLFLDAEGGDAEEAARAVSGLLNGELNR